MYKLISCSFPEEKEERIYILWRVMLVVFFLLLVKMNRKKNYKLC